jgi:ADP-ribose pyrophosphatase YjhB (NUDIX family)
MEQIPYIKYIRDMVGDHKILLTAACVVLVNEANEVLLQERTDSKRWGLPGGLMELEESIVDCAIREVKEETSLDIQLTGFIGVFNNPLMKWFDHDEARILAFAFTAKIVQGTLRVNDHESLSFRYFPYDSLPTLHSKDTYEIIDAYYHQKYNLIEGRSFQ